MRWLFYKRTPLVLGGSVRYQTNRLATPTGTKTNQSTNGATMQANQLISAERALRMPSRQQLEVMRTHAIIQLRERENARKLNAARRALSAANKLKNPAQKKLHRSRIFSAMNKLRAAG